jgi:hypothetical protein
MKYCRICKELKRDSDFTWSPQEDVCGDCYLKESKE